MSRSTDATIHSEDWVLEQLAMYGEWLKGPANIGLSGETVVTNSGVVFIDPITDDALVELSQTRSAERVSDGANPRHAWVAAAVLLALGLAAWAVASLSDGTEEPAVRMDLVLDGEQVLSTNPLIVLPAPADAPQFDTSVLGEDVSVEPATAMGPEYQALIDGWSTSYDTLELIKVSLIGVMDGEPWAMIVGDEHDTAGVPAGREGDVHRWRSAVSDGSLGASGEYVYADSLDLITPREPISGSFGSSYPTGWFQWDGLSPEVSVVSFADADRNLWVRPSGGIALFWGQFDDGESWTATAYDKNGVVLSTRTEVAGRASDSESTNPKVGDLVLDLGTSEGDANKPTIVLLGAGWCVPCNQDLEGLVDGLSGIATQVNVYSKAHYHDGLEWPPSDSDWPYERLGTETQALNQWGSVPLALLLDSDNKLVAYDKSLAELASDLEALGIELGDSSFWK